MSAFTTSRALCIYAFLLGLAAAFAFGNAAGLTFWGGIVLGQLWGMQRLRERFPYWIRSATSGYRSYEQQRFLEEHDPRYRGSNHARTLRSVPREDDA